MSIIQTLKQQGCRVQVDTVKTSEDKVVYEATIEQRSPKGNVYKTLDVVEFDDLVNIEETLKNWYKDFTEKQNVKGISRFRLSIEDGLDYSFVNLIIQGEVTKEEFIDMYNEVISEKSYTHHDDLAEEMCSRFGFSIDEPIFEINGRYTGYTPISNEVRNSKSISVELGFEGEESESFIEETHKEG
ncbi:hypothetical protein [Bacillus toyonensis]|uniref:hypothetical protein n=1 Tax=Bacillus toyonensis TaxID=155322 RepID=UPI000BF7AB67|nr:hypothetical protein [Bacillus toyonensis]PGF05272.1 hypothetical protein COM61_02350 [Bacillus toyonensis]